MDLSGFGDNTYDVTLVLGPMYHLYTQEDQLQALREALRVTRPGGMLYVAYCISDASVLDHGFKRGFAQQLIEKKMMDPETFRTFSTPADVFQLYRKEDVDGLMDHFAVTRLHYVATDLMTNHMRETVDAMDEGMFELYLKYHFSVCERMDMVGMTHHSLDVVRKV